MGGVRGNSHIYPTKKDPSNVPEGMEEEPNREGLEFYHNVFAECRRYDIEPLVTLHHFEMQLALVKNYGVGETEN